MDCSKLASLEFVDPATRDRLLTWNPHTEGAYATGNKLGRDYADAMLSFMQETYNPTTMGKTAAVLPVGELLRPICVGFYHRIGERLLAD